MRTLMVCHNHPDLHPGGTEVVSHALFRELDRRPDHEAFYLACTNDQHRKPNPGTPFLGIDDRPNEVLMWCGNFDRFRLSQLDLHGLLPEFARFLQQLRPDVVHFHHLLLIGVEAIKVVRDTLPAARIVVTLHDYYPICHHNGQMVRTEGFALCEKASPDACAACFPDRASDEFLTRELHIKTFLSLVDAFVAPSEFLRQRYRAWGLDADRITVIGNGSTRSASEQAPARRRDPGAPVTFGFFGNLSRQKGVDLLLEAAAVLRRRATVDFELQVHGDPLFQPEAFVEGLEREAAASDGRVRLHGGYRREQLPALLAGVDCVVVPSIWWENDPIVIQEALWARRPVLCADIGGMAQAVVPGEDGLHFRARDALSLADAMASFVRDFDDEPPCPATVPAPIEAVVDRHLAVYAHDPVPVVEPIAANQAGG